MTVKELIRQLKGIPEDVVVLIGTVPDQCDLMLERAEGVHHENHPDYGPRVVIGDHDYFAGLR